MLDGSFLIKIPEIFLKKNCFAEPWKSLRFRQREKNILEFNKSYQ